jgi:hypothetical protein
MKLHFTSGYHPSADGQTERVNQTLEQYIRIYCNYQQDNWSKLLPLAEFAYNNAPSETTGVSLFFANKGYNPAVTVHPEHDITNLAALDLAVDLQELHVVLKEEIRNAQLRYQVAADRRRIPAPDFKVGDEVYVRAKDFTTTRPTRKFTDIFQGPCKVVAQVGPSSFSVKLPKELSGVHPVFHVSQLETHTPSLIPNRVTVPPPSVLVDQEIQYLIQEILDSKIDKRYRCKLRYFVAWDGYEETDDAQTWIAADELEHALELVADFHAQYPSKPGPDY